MLEKVSAQKVAIAMRIGRALTSDLSATALISTGQITYSKVVFFSRNVAQAAARKLDYL